MRLTAPAVFVLPGLFCTERGTAESLACVSRIQLFRERPAKPVFL